MLKTVGLLALSASAAALVLPSAGMRAPRMASSHISMMDYGETPAHGLIRTPARALFTWHTNARAVRAPHVLAAEYLSSRGMAATTPIATPVPAPTADTSYDEYLKARGVVAPSSQVAAPAPEPAAASAYEEYLKSRGMATPAAAAEPAAPAAPLYDPMANFAAETTRDPEADAVAPAAASAPAAAKPPAPAPAPRSFAPKEVSPWDSDLAVCEFVVDGVVKRYRIMQ